MARSKSTKTKTKSPAMVAEKPVLPAEKPSTEISNPVSKSPKAVAEAVVAKATSNSPYQLDKSQIHKAARALLKHLAVEKDENSKPNLLEDPDSPADSAVALWLILNTKKYISDTRKLKPAPIRVPHSLTAASATGSAPTVCLIVKDPQRHFKDLIADAGLSATVTKVVGVGKLRKKFKTFEQRRQLLQAHDVFLADDRIVAMLPQALGSVFYKQTAKVPVPISLQGRNTTSHITKEIQKALSSTYLHLVPSATTSIRIGMSSFTPEQVVENIDATVTQLTEKRIPGGWRNIKSLHLKSPESAALPIWLAQDFYGEEDVLKPEEEQERNLAVAKAAAERKERKELKKRKSMGDEKEGNPATKKAKVDKKDERTAESVVEEQENDVEVEVPSDIEQELSETEVEAPMKKTEKPKKDASKVKKAPAKAGKVKSTGSKGKKGKKA